MKYHFRSLLLLFCALFFSFQSNASTINFLAKGTDNIPDGFNESPSYNLDLTDPSANFFQIYFSHGFINEYISKVSINLQAGSDNDAIFDPNDGFADPSQFSNGGGKGFGPVIGAETVGLDLSDVSFSLTTGSATSAILDIIFNPGSFAVGDILSFGVDIDLLNDNLANQGGGLLGSQSVGLTTTLHNSCEQTINGVFEKKSENRSESIIDICAPKQQKNETVPEPASLWLIFLGLGFLLLNSKKTTSFPV